MDTEQFQRDMEFFYKEIQRIEAVGFYSLDITEGKWTSSDGLDAVFGIEPDEEKTLTSWNNLVHPEEREEMLKYFFHSVLAKKRQFNKEYRIIRKKDGAVRWVWGKGELKLDENGTPLRMFGVIQDITERKETEFEKDHLLLFNKRLIENSPIGILLYKASSGQCVLANESAATTLGATTEKLLSQNFRKIPSWKDSGLLKSAEQTIETEESRKFTANFITTFGRNVWLDCQMASLFMEGEKHILLMIIDITARMLIDEALKESEEKFRTIFDNASDGILIADTVTKKFVMGNKMICEMLGYEKREIINIGLADIHPKEALPKVTKAFEKQIRKEIELAENLPIKRKDGSVFFADINSSPITIKGEIYLLGVFRDITERKLAKEALQKSEEKFFSLFENARDPILLLDETSRFIDCNQATLKILGAESKEQFLPKHPSELSPEYQPDGQLSNIKAEQMIKNGYEHGSTQFEWVHKKLDGTPIFMDISLTVIPNENKNILMVHWRDITKRKQSEEELRISKELFKSIIELAADGILLGSSKGIIIGANQQICKITGYTDQELVGRNISFLFSEEVLKKSPLRYDLLDLGMVVRNERIITRKDGSLVPIEMNTKKMPDGTYQAIIRDTSERLKSEVLNRKIEKAEYENKVKSQFMANLSHEIRNPLNAILGLNSTLIRTSLNPEQKKFAEAIDLSANNLLNILNNILDFSKIEANKSGLNFENFELIKLIKNIVLLYQQKCLEKGIQLHYSVSNEIPEYIYSDKNKLQQIITNLFSNAIKFTEYGKVELSATLKKHDESDLIVEFAITDSGIGIQHKDFDKIFQSFTQLDSSTKKIYAGTGLGLSISKSYIEMLGGEISFTSKFGKGSEFKFWLPVKTGKPNFEKKLNTSRSIKNFNFNSSVPLSVLVAEDDGINRLYLGNLLKSKGIKVDFAIDGFGVLELFYLNKYDLVLMDSQMPRMDGFEAAQKIREYEKQNNYPSTPIITISGYNLNDVKEDFIKSGINDYILKPINETELLRKILNIVQKK